MLTNIPTTDRELVEHARGALGYVREHFERGHGSKLPSSSQRDAGGGNGNGPGSRPPLPVHLLDALTGIEESLNAAWPDITRAAGTSPSFAGVEDTLTARTGARLVWLDVHLLDVATFDAALCARLAAEWLAGGRQVAGALGERTRPFQTAGQCPSCVDAGLWLSPEHMVVKCEECFDEWPIGSAPAGRAALTANA